MKPKILLTLTFFGLGAHLLAQQSIVTAGDNATGSGGSVSYSVGQVSYTTVSGTNGTVMQGVQQPYEIYTLSGEEYTQISLSLKVFPNPTSSFLTLQIEDLDTEGLIYVIYDINGKTLQENEVSETETTVNLQDYEAGIYLFNVLNNNTLLKSFKIIKN